MHTVHNTPQQKMIAYTARYSTAADCGIYCTELHSCNCSRVQYSAWTFTPTQWLFCQAVYTYFFNKQRIFGYTLHRLDEKAAEGHAISARITLALFHYVAEFWRFFCQLLKKLSSTQLPAAETDICCHAW